MLFIGIFPKNLVQFSWGFLLLNIKLNPLSLERLSSSRDRRSSSKGGSEPKTECKPDPEPKTEQDLINRAAKLSLQVEYII